MTFAIQRPAAKRAVTVRERSLHPRLLVATVLVFSGLALREPPARAAEDRPTPEEIASLLPSDGSRGDVVGVVRSKRLEELLQRLKAALRADPTWAAEHFRRAPVGKPLPYDPKLGLSKTEYDELRFLLANTKAQLVGRTPIRVKKVGKGGAVVSISSGPELPRFRDVVVDLETLTVKTPHGSVPFEGRIKAVPEQKLTGPWDGFYWRGTVTSHETKTIGSVRFSIGKLRSSGRGVLSYELTGEFSYIVEYDLPAKK